VLFERSQDALYVSRPDGTLVEANDRFLELFGYSRAEASSLSTGDLYVDHEDRERFQSTIDREGFVLEFPVRLKHKGGKVLDCIITATARQDVDQKVVEYQGIIRDASPSRPLHALADRRTRELRDATSELETFTLTVSHDLRTHLVTMGGFASILWSEHRESLNEDGQEFLRRIVAAARRMDAFIEDLLNYARVRSADVELERVELGSVVQQTLARLEAQIAERDAQVCVSQNLPDVVADRVLLARVLENLVLNGVKFVRDGDPPSVTITADEEGGRVRLKVRDQGIGIPSDRLASVFRAFERVEPGTYPGTGVGLTVVQKAVQRMGGDVGVRSTPGQGSTFWVLLRAAGPSDTEEPEA
jgi:PAS domain S-box-containing protein